MAKHSKPLKQEIITFPPYPDTLDPCRETTVLPYLEVFYKYGGVEGQGMEDHRWNSQDEGLFDISECPSASQSLASVTRERSLETISGRRSRVSSQENGKITKIAN